MADQERDILDMIVEGEYTPEEMADFLVDEGLKGAAGRLIKKAGHLFGKIKRKRTSAKERMKMKREARTAKFKLRMKKATRRKKARGGRVQTGKGTAAGLQIARAQKSGGTRGKRIKLA